MVIHSDVWGPSKISTLGGSRWFVTFIDDCNRVTWLWLMKSKSEVNLLFQKFHKMIKTQYNAQIQVLRSDNGGEYKSSELKHFFEVEGIINQTTCSNTPQQNGVAERKNRHLLEVVRAILIEAHMPLSYWGEAIAFAVYSINRTPSRSIAYKTPFKALSDVVIAPTVPNLPLRIFGFVVFIHLHKHERSKLAPRALRCIFLGYAMHKKGYRCYHPPTQRMFITVDVVFHEELMYFSPKAELQGEYRKIYDPVTGSDVLDTSEISLDIDINSPLEDEDIITQQNPSPLVEDEEVSGPETENPSFEELESLANIPYQSSLEVVPLPYQLPERLNRGIPKTRYEPEISSKVKYPMSHYVSNHNMSESNKSFANQLSVISIPNSVQDALADPKWKAAMNEEMNSLQKNET